MLREGDEVELLWAWQVTALNEVRVVQHSSATMCVCVRACAFRRGSSNTEICPLVHFLLIQNTEISQKTTAVNYYTPEVRFNVVVGVLTRIALACVQT